MNEFCAFLKANCCCLWGNNIVYVTEGDRFFVKFNPNTGESEVLNWPLLIDRPSTIFFYKEHLYAIDSKGKWIAKLEEKQHEFIYMRIPKNLICTGYLYVCLYEQRLYLLPKDSMCLLIFDMETGSFCSKLIDLPQGLEPAKADICVAVKGCLVIFCSNVHKVIEYSLEELRIRQISDIIETDRFINAIYEKNTIYVIANNVIYKYENNKLSLIVSIDSKEKITKLCITESNIWALPGQGKEIFIFSIKNKVLKKMTQYPKDFFYEDKEGWTKFQAKAEINDCVFWLMRVGNYTLEIDKKNDTAKWISHVLSNKVDFEKKLCHRKLLFDERLFSLSSFIKCIQEI